MVTFKEFFSFKNNRFFWLNLIAMVVVIVAAAWGTLQWLDSYTRHGEAVVVVAGLIVCAAFTSFMIISSLSVTLAGITITCPIRKFSALSPGFAWQMRCAVTP